MCSRFDILFERFFKRQQYFKATPFFALEQVKVLPYVHATGHLRSLDCGPNISPESTNTAAPSCLKIQYS